MADCESLTQRYERDLSERNFNEDPGQRRAINALEDLANRLSTKKSSGLLHALGLASTKEPEKGLYLWGGVGRGKTYLVDLFFECLGPVGKRRNHFHRFMQDIHSGLTRYRDRSDPLRHIAKDIARDAQVLCFDEFFVSDIGDAMILGTVLEALFRESVTLVATSNVPPQDLYKDGLQRQRFLPAIELLRNNTHILEIGSGTDYRLAVLESAEIYHHPLDAIADENLARYFEEIAPEKGHKNFTLPILGRDIQTRRCADGVLWCDFKHLCTAPRGAADYLEIARLFHTVMLSGLPILDENSDDDARRFIAMVDVLYDHRVKLIISAAADAAEIYKGERLAFEFRRTYSRLTEMQQSRYLAQQHIA